VKFTAMLSSNGSLPNGQEVTFSYAGKTIGCATIFGGKATLSTTAMPSGETWGNMGTDGTYPDYLLPIWKS
jgi:hypothetical protein